MKVKCFGFACFKQRDAHVLSSLLGGGLWINFQRKISCEESLIDAKIKRNCSCKNDKKPSLQNTWLYMLGCFEYNTKYFYKLRCLCQANHGNTSTNFDLMQRQIKKIGILVCQQLSNMIALHCHFVLTYLPNLLSLNECWCEWWDVAWFVMFNVFQAVFSGRDAAQPHFLDQYTRKLLETVPVTASGFRGRDNAKLHTKKPWSPTSDDVHSGGARSKWFQPGNTKANCPHEQLRRWRIVHFFLSSQSQGHETFEPFAKMCLLFVHGYFSPVHRRMLWKHWLCSIKQHNHTSYTNTLNLECKLFKKFQTCN